LGQIYDKCEGDDNIYVNGRLGHHNIVLCYLPRPGKGNAASVASGLLISYTGVQLALVVGICGGAPYASCQQDIILGDVIISDAVVEYDSGRQYPIKFERKTDIQITLRSPPRGIRTLLAALKTSRSHSELQNKISTHCDTLCQVESRWRHPGISEDVLYETSYHHKHHSQDGPAVCPCFGGDSPDNICQKAVETDCNYLGCDSSQIRRHRHGVARTKATIHIGKVASADTVMKSGEHRDEIIRTEGVIGFEMEGAGVWDNIPCIIIKGVCDYADSHKSKAWQSYAAAIGASAAKAFLGYWKVQPAKRGGKMSILRSRRS
jgi:nucleoside phosphorylase